MFDEYLNPPPSVVSPVSAAAAPRPADPTGVEELLQPAHFNNDPFQDILAQDPSSQESSSNVQPPNPPFELLDPRDHRNIFKETVSEPVVPVQDKALDALIAYLKAADAHVAGGYAKEICDAIVANCLTDRPETVSKAQIVFMLWVELEAVDAVLDAMEKAIKTQVSKAVLPAVDVMFQAISEFGSKIVPPNRLLKMLPEIYDHQDQNVRASSKRLTLELCRWIGRDPVKSILFEKMSDTMEKELDAELANVTVAAKPTRKIRSEQMKEPEQKVATDATRSGPSEENAAEIPLGKDKYKLVDPVDILTPLEKTGFWNKVKSKKWKERKEAVAKLTKLASTKRIAPGDFTDLCRILEKLVMDLSIVVRVGAVRAIGNLALGLRINFSSYSHILLPVLLSKLTEKKPIMEEALTNTLQAIYKARCVTLANIIMYVRAAVKSEDPHVCSRTLNWVMYCITSSNKAVTCKVHKDYVQICLECLDDGTAEVRDAAFSVLVAIAKGYEAAERYVRAAVKSEDPHVCSRTLNWVMYCITSSNKAVTCKVHKDYVQICLECLDDGTAEVRDAAFSVLVAIAKSVGMGLLNSSLEKLDYVRHRKLPEMIGVSRGRAPTVVRHGIMKQGSSRKRIAEPSEMTIEENESRLESLFQEHSITQLKNAAWKEPLEETNQLQKMSPSDSQEQKQRQHTGSEFVFQEQNKKRKRHTGSEYGFRHFVKAVWGEDVVTDEEDLEAWKEELEWIKSLECTRCGMNCFCQRELEINMEKMQPDPEPWCPSWE
ncbi:protein MOR1 isoform X1 [Tanacetum coccineum]